MIAERSPTRRRLAGAALLGTLLLVPAGGGLRAAIEGGPHDLIAQEYDAALVSATQERCSRCHIPGSAPAEAVPAVPPVLLPAWDAASLTCFSCHDGTTIVAPEVDASLTAFHPLSHGLQLGGYRDLLRQQDALPLASEERMSCLTCHDPHDSTNRPFLRRRLGELCEECHSPLAGAGRGAVNRSGNHPIGPLPGAGAEPSAPLDIAAPFRVGFPAPYPLLGGREARGAHWDLGGHLHEGDRGDLACYTCHAVHGDEAAPPVRGLLTVDPVREIADLLCEGCHAGVRADGVRSPARPNPGGTLVARTYHPADDDRSNGEGRILAVEIPPAWPSGKGDPAPLLCTTCHRAHGAEPGAWLTRTPASGQTFCEECHHDAVLENHHPLAADGSCGAVLGEKQGVSGRRLTCAACHRAHNAGLGSADEKLHVPLLKLPADAEACLSCHAEDNPTCNEDPNFRASHFLGDPAEFYGDLDPPLFRDPWPPSALPSRFGGKDDRSVTCLSCHSFAAGSVTSGDAGDQPYLLAHSGNPVEWEEDGEKTYLCTGCHSANPGTGEGNKGHSHPMMDALGDALGTGPVPPTTLTPQKRVNCDSCHRPHEAPTRGGYYILEVVTGENTDPRAVGPAIDFTGLCLSCHDPTKY